MRDIWRLFRSGMSQLSRSGKRVLLLYGCGLVLLTALDGIALYFVSRIFTSSANGKSIDIDSGGRMLAAIVTLFALKTVLSTLISWVSVKRFALEEVRIGSSNYSKLMTKKIIDHLN